MIIRTFKAGLRTADLPSLSPTLFNFFPQQALSRMPTNIFKLFDVNQLQNLNIEQIRTIPTSLLSSLDENKMAILQKILFPFRTSG